MAKQALTTKGLNQTKLIARLKCSRQPVSKFFNGKAVDSEIFCGICEILGLNAQDVAYQDNEVEVTDIDSLVQEVRQKIKPLIQERCGTMRVLDMNQPIGLNDIYTNVNILEKITGRTRKEITELFQECNFEEFDRFGLGRISEKRVPGLEAVEKYPKLMILGKPGAGKTTFLKYLAIQSVEGKFKTELVPIFITLKDFAEAKDKPNLLEYISQQLSTCQVTGNHVVEIFQHNKGLVLLDGLDEVREEDNQRVLKEIRDFSDQFRDNRFVMTCRIAAKEYSFEKFSEVEVADFDEQQIATFANNWFKNQAVKPENFLYRLQENQRIYELATNPLLLTLLCLVFEESGDFPANRSELYKEGIDALLKKWDAKRGIYRDQVYKKLSVQRKEDLFSKVALNTFESSDYFFKQRVAEQHIIKYIRNLPDASTDPEVLQLDSERVLKSIEAQHGLLVERAKGIYSFSHLTFHEYFTAREFITVQQSSEIALKNLVSQMMEKRWQEVFLLAVGMSPSADSLLLLMKEQSDKTINNEKEIQQLLKWACEKSISVNLPYKLASIRAFYLFRIDRRLSSLNRSQYEIIINALEANLSFDVSRVYGLERAFRSASELALDLELATVGEHTPSGQFQLTRAYNLVNRNDEDLKQALSELIAELPKPLKPYNYEKISFINKLKPIMIKHRNIGHDWQLSGNQEILLNQYSYANKLLIDCLNSDCYVSREVRQYIEDTLLLPICEIEKYSKPNF
ncbi:NACHT domain-containing protein [[Phormidium] sp. LEGE 05292]|uniref:NACHT domain-containing protein n=1 Tax=[Phormidium] sp. LEGE 05292 TaxID=767427 RepID=UPI001D13FB69|nr:NACHT domain-containing NTPase [Phormidium sp. LEGE 05292]